MEKKIAVIEINTHAEVLQNFLNIVGELPFSVDVYVVRKVYNRLKIRTDLTNMPNFYIINRPYQVSRFLKNKIDDINACDVVIVNTLETHFKLFSRLKFKIPVICRVHNSNTFFAPVKNLYFGSPVKDITYVVKRLILNLDVVYRPRFLNKKVDRFWFPSLTTNDYAVKKGYVNSDALLEPIPLVYRDDDLRPFEKKSGSVVISIIGGVDKRRRDYARVVEAFRRVVPILDKKVELILLGKPVGNYGKDIVGQFKALESDLFSVRSYSEFVPYEEFNHVLEISDFQIIPVNCYSKYKIFREEYGKTKISGNVNDMILHGVPALIPDYYILDKGLHKMASSYTGVEDLKNKLSEWINTREYASLNVQDALKSYTFSQVKRQYYEVLSSIKGI